MNCKIVTSFSARYSEFPELLFASDVTGTNYFDATHYIHCKEKSLHHSVADFTRKFEFWIESVKEVYEVGEDVMLVIDNATNHTLLDESLALLFVCYVDPHFSIHIIERISEMLLNGSVLSDSCIAQMARDRFNLQNK